MISFFFFFNDTATTEIYPLSLHDALPISRISRLPNNSNRLQPSGANLPAFPCLAHPLPRQVFAVNSSLINRKSTRLNSSHQIISYAVFCLKKKKNNSKDNRMLFTTRISAN